MHIVYFSPTGGTRKAAYIIGKEIDPQATEIDITGPYTATELLRAKWGRHPISGCSRVWRESSFRSHRSTETV